MSKKYWVFLVVAGAVVAILLVAANAQPATVVIIVLLVIFGALAIPRLKEYLDDQRFQREEASKLEASVDFARFIIDSGIHRLANTTDEQTCFLDESSEVTEGFILDWKGYANDRFDELMEFDPVIEILFLHSEWINNDYSFHSEPHLPLQDWVRKALCASAISIYYCDTRTEELFEKEVREKVMYFVLNLRRQWAEFLVGLLVFIDAMEQTRHGVEKHAAYNSSQDKLVRKHLVGVYEEITSKCNLIAENMDDWVRKLLKKTNFSDQESPELHIADLEDGRLAIYWGDTASEWRKGRSCTYLLDWGGGAVVKETNEFVVFKDWKQFPYIAATIIRDVFGNYDYEGAVDLLGDDIASYLAQKKARKNQRNTLSE